MSKKERNKIIVEGVSFVFGVFLLALCYNLFFVPNNLVVGGTSGLAIVIEELTGLNKQIFIYVTAILLLIISYIFLGKDLTKNTLIGSLLYPFFITLTGPLAEFILKYLVFEEELVVVILAGLLYGASNGIIYKYGYTTGGSDVVVQLLSKYAHISCGKGTGVFNAFVIISGASVFGINNAVYALMIAVIESVVVDKIVLGSSESKKFIIYTRDYRKVRKLIIDTFGAGYTVFPTVGGYSHKNGKMIMCVIRNRDVNLFKEKLQDIDSEVFFVISDCYEVKGGVRKSNIPFIGY